MPRPSTQLGKFPEHRAPGAWRVSQGSALLLLLCLLLATPAVGQDCTPAVPVAEGLLDSANTADGLTVSGSFGLDEAALEEGRLVGLVQAEVDLSGLRRRQGLGQARLCVSLVVEGDGLVSVHHRAIEAQDLSRSSRWFYAFATELPEETEQLILVVEERGAGLLGAAALDEAEGSLGPPPGATRLAGGDPAWMWRIERGSSGPSASGTGAAYGRAAKGSVVRLVPPRKDLATGGTRFDALVTSDAVRSVAFYLDGKKITERRLRPFATRLDLADPPRPQEVRAVALDRGGRTMGEDTLVVNRLDAPFRVKIERLDIGKDFTEIAAKVSVPAGTSLERVEIFRNQELLATQQAPPFRVRFPSAEVTTEDYVSVTAYLSDGSSIDDVALLAAGVVEEVDVNLVQVQVVVTDANGRPVDDLDLQDFEVLQRGQPRRIESLAYADDVPLLLGLVIDTSGSMRMIMDATKKAAVRFLGDTIVPGDRAFLVDFAKQPRLLQDTSGELTDLFLGLGRLRPEGTTALYDAVVFSMVQFEEQPGRKALVVLSDGDDRESRYGPKHCVEYGQRAGVPVYLIGLGALDDFVRNLPKGELRKITRGTGGRLFLVDGLPELGQAYARIQEELRSQYTVSFYTETDLTAEEKRELTVRLKRPGLTARTVVGASSP